MWKCKNCSEQIEENYDSCWSCGYSREGSPPKEGSEAWAEKIKSEVVEDITPKSSQLQGVALVDVSIPFWSMVVLMVKFSLAAIPALIILVVVYFFAGMILSTLFR